MSLAEHAYLASRSLSLPLGISLQSALCTVWSVLPSEWSHDACHPNQSCPSCIPLSQSRRAGAPQTAEAEAACWLKLLAHEKAATQVRRRTLSGSKQRREQGGVRKKSAASRRRSAERTSSWVRNQPNSFSDDDGESWMQM